MCTYAELFRQNQNKITGHVKQCLGAYDPDNRFLCVCRPALLTSHWKIARIFVSKNFRTFLGVLTQSNFSRRRAERSLKYAIITPKSHQSDPTFPHNLSLIFNEEKRTFTSAGPLCRKIETFLTLLQEWQLFLQSSEREKQLRQVLLEILVGYRKLPFSLVAKMAAFKVHVDLFRFVLLWLVVQLQVGFPGVVSGNEILELNANAFDELSREDKCIVVLFCKY